jgi:lipid A 4'-phosphatase
MSPYLQKLLLIFLASHVVFASVPAIDLWAAGLFYDPARGGFWLAQSGFVLGLRRIMMNMMLILPLVALIMVPISLWKPRVSRIGAIGWGKILAVFLLGPGLLVNGILKAHWGRARPAYVTDFGGDAQFTPPFQIADQCVKNCSFVSGEASGAVAVAIALFALSASVQNPSRAAAWRAFAIAFAVIGSAMRILMGRHFFSDTVFAVLFVLLISYALTRLFERSFGASQAK